MLKTADLKKIRKSMEKELDAKRYEHTLGVAYTAAALAMCNDVDPVKAETAGLLHDCAKCFSDDKKISVCRKNNMEINSVESRNPYLLHAKAGYCIAKNKFDIEDQDILNAILNHTTGRPGMSTLEKIIYIADYIEPSRKQAPNLSEVRKLAFQNLDQALLKILTDILSYLESGGGEIDPLTKETYDYYADLLAKC
ncbi:MAG: bis(5'-nucleosyl)-tetraphosphatase (symmetrical) YqeK [Lachnospiraceae bacterium]|nr:bis(5'-nucleosyl)-tetraphosphatase (symmetrical) YqeK [Lachnospiraceae bacterium]MDD7628238.1 bis(5'-nucleosyl)-tetraphosphatase (symmetrical) YqeK [Lachnospiraceae bacterium]MDY4118227.1 bis(5'-nucleosyl)-tetraphosphatase (symmetrical) YqeK [Lachnospiraceae bacterium]